MVRLIDADAIPFRDELKRLSVLDHDKYITAETLEYMLEHAPTVEAVPVEWIEAWNDKAWSNHDGMHGWFEKLIEEWRNENGKAD